MQKKTYQLLVVDDDAADLDLIREALSLSHDRPYNIHLNTVEDGEKALSFLKREEVFQDALRPDLIILDLNMPGKGGHEILQKIKADERFRDIPVVVLTTSSAFEDAKKSYQLGASSFISKARDFSDFSRIIKTIEDYWLKVATLPPAQ